MINEIGSEFSINPLLHGSGINLPKDVVDFTYTFSGRTAIETVLKNELHIKKVLLPSYCCDAMIEPFRAQGIDVEFYDVNYNEELEIDLNIQDNVDAILWCNYFGYYLKMPNLNDFINRGGIIIEDITHSFYSETKYNKQSNYLIASIRKWEPILCGGYCASLKNKMNYKPSKLPSENYLKKKKNAMVLKKEYLDGNTFINKDEFLSEFSTCNKWLKENYSELFIDQDSIHILSQIDYEKNVKKRRENAIELYKSLNQRTTLKFLFDETLMDCPLFVPILIKCGKRDKLRHHLIENGIYCPVHWPKPNMNCKSNLYDLELSLICDQRYNKKNMQRIAEIINNFDI